MHTGPYETIRSAYDALGTWLAKHLEYQVCGPVIERFLCDEEMVQNPEEQKTAVLFPVTPLQGTEKGDMMKQQG